MIMSLLSRFFLNYFFPFCVRHASVSCALISLDFSHVMWQGTDSSGLNLEWHFPTPFFLLLLWTVNASKDFIITKSNCLNSVFFMLCLVIYCIFKRELGTLGKIICNPRPAHPFIEKRRKKLYHVPSKAWCFPAKLLTKVCSFVFAVFQNVFQGPMLLSALHSSFNEQRSMPTPAALLHSLAHSAPASFWVLSSDLWQIYWCARSGQTRQRIVLAAQFSDDAELNIYLQDVMQAILFLMTGD